MPDQIDLLTLEARFVRDSFRFGNLAIRRSSVG
jgi:hypothetical protein